MSNEQKNQSPEEIAKEKIQALLSESAADTRDRLAALREFKCKLNSPQTQVNSRSVEENNSNPSITMRRL